MTTLTTRWRTKRAATSALASRAAGLSTNSSSDLTIRYMKCTSRIASNPGAAHILAGWRGARAGSDTSHEAAVPARLPASGRLAGLQFGQAPAAARSVSRRTTARSSQIPRRSARPEPSRRAAGARTSAACAEGPGPPTGLGKLARHVVPIHFRHRTLATASSRSTHRQPVVPHRPGTRPLSLVYHQPSCRVERDRLRRA
jgi:hypothetical protein